jgi:hypothetical protein
MNEGKRGVRWIRGVNAEPPKKHHSLDIISLKYRKKVENITFLHAYSRSENILQGNGRREQGGRSVIAKSGTT